MLRRIIASAGRVARAATPWPVALVAITLWACLPSRALVIAPHGGPTRPTAVSTSNASAPVPMEVPAVVPPPVEAAAPLAVDAPPEALVVARWRRVLHALPAPLDDCGEIPDGAVEPLERVRVALDDYLARALASDRCGSPRHTERAVADCLDAGLREADALDRAPADLPYWGDVNPVEVSVVPGQRGWLLITSTLALGCSEDARVMLYHRQGGPRIVEPVERITFGREGHAYTRAWAVPRGREAPLLVLAYQDEWCMSRWRRRGLRVLEATTDPRRPREVWSEVHSMDTQSHDTSDDPPPPDDLVVSIRGGVISLAWDSRRVGFDARLDRLRLYERSVRVRLAPDPRRGVREVFRHEAASEGDWE